MPIYIDFHSQIHYYESAAGHILFDGIASIGNWKKNTKLYLPNLFSVGL